MWWGVGTNFVGGGGGGLSECVRRRRSRRVVLTTEVTPYVSVYSTMFEHRHSQIVVDDGLQTYIQDNTVYSDIPENHTRKHNVKYRPY